MVTKQSAIRTVRILITEIKNAGVPVKKAFVFGSYAKNKQQKFSDIDLALAADDFTGVPSRDIKRLLAILAKDDYMMIELHTFHSKDFNRTNPFVNEILKTGIEIHT